MNQPEVIESSATSMGANSKRVHFNLNKNSLHFFANGNDTPKILDKVPEAAASPNTDTQDNPLAGYKIEIGEEKNKIIQTFEDDKENKNVKRDFFGINDDNERTATFSFDVNEKRHLVDHSQNDKPERNESDKDSRDISMESRDSGYLNLVADDNSKNLNFVDVSVKKLESELDAQQKLTEFQLNTSNSEVTLESDKSPAVGSVKKNPDNESIVPGDSTNELLIDTCSAPELSDTQTFERETTDSICNDEVRSNLGSTSLNYNTGAENGNVLDFEEIGSEAILVCSTDATPDVPPVPTGFSNRDDTEVIQGENIVDQPVSSWMSKETEFHTITVNAGDENVNSKTDSALGGKNEMCFTAEKEQGRSLLLERDISSKCNPTVDDFDISAEDALTLNHSHNQLEKTIDEKQNNEIKNRKNHENNCNTGESTCESSVNLTCKDVYRQSCEEKKYTSERDENNKISFAKKYLVYREQLEAKKIKSYKNSSPYEVRTVSGYDIDGEYHDMLGKALESYTKFKRREKALSLETAIRGLQDRKRNAFPPRPVTPRLRERVRSAPPLSVLPPREVQSPPVAYVRPPEPLLKSGAAIKEIIKANNVQDIDRRARTTPRTTAMDSRLHQKLFNPRPTVFESASSRCGRNPITDTLNTSRTVKKGLSDAHFLKTRNTDLTKNADYKYKGGFFSAHSSPRRQFYTIHPDWVSENLNVQKLSLSDKYATFPQRRCRSAPPPIRRNPITWQ